MVGVKSPPFPLIQLQMHQRPSKPRSKRCAARRNRASDDEIELGTVYFFFFIISISRARFITTKRVRVL